jgi:glycosyltransferase involved in cell wall biosynthesis
VTTVPLTRQVRILYVNHTSQVSGGEHSLLEVLAALPARISPTVACPEGELAERIRRLGLPVAPIRATAGSLRLHPWHTSKALAEIAAQARSIRQVARSSGADLVNGNSVRAGIAASLAVRTAPVVVHVRDCLPESRATALSVRPIDRRARLLLANSGYTERSFARLATRPASKVLYDPVDLERFDPGRISREEARSRLDLAPDDKVLGVLAQLTPWKGQDDAIRLVARLRERHPEVRLLLVGSAKFLSAATRFDNRAYLRELERMTAELGLERQVTFMGEREDAAAIVRALDVLLVPSWEEPFGRTVIEGMAMGVPVVATSVGGPAESLRDGVDGFHAPPRDVDRWVESVDALLSSADLRRRMGESGRRRAVEKFNLPAHVDQLIELYDEALGAGARRPRPGAPS